MAKLTYQQRKRLPASAFAVDGVLRKYPIHDEAHARNALARVARFGTPEEKAIVRAAVARRYPNIKQSTPQPKVEVVRRAIARLKARKKRMVGK